MLGVGALLLTPGAPGEPDVPGDPTPPAVTPVITGTLGADGWYTSNVTVNWSVTDPESIILSTSGCDARTFTADTVSTKLTCTAESDGGETIVSKTFKLDKTAPAASASPSRSADSNGWYNHALSVEFAGGDTTSGVASCSAPRSYAGPDTAGTSLTGTCVDRAGNSAQASLPLKYDETAPQASPAARPADANGWYNHAVTVSFQGVDATSGVSSCTQTTYSGPDDPSVAVTGTCLDEAGNSSTSSQFTLRYDETAPQAAASASRLADVNSWYNRPLTVTFAGSDEMSGLDSCDAPKTYSGPDAAAASVAGSCRDNAGNTSPRSLAVKYDATPPQATATPSRQPNGNGWYNAPLTVSFAGTDAMSGNASCVAAKSYGGPDSSSATVAGTCTDNAGNVGTASLPLKYDAMPPQSTATPARQPNANGWYRASLSVSFAGTDATSGIDACDEAKSYAGPDTASAQLSGSCRDRAGNQSSVSTFGFKYDATAPQATANPSRQPNAAGWYTAQLAVTFAGTDVLSGLESCDAQKTYSGPDASSTDVTGSCQDKAGNTASASFPLKYDATPPQATATPSRQPNANGWYNAPLTIGFSGGDATSGLDSCDSPTSYGGPDSASTVVAGSCRDKAGNTGGTSLQLKYDATAPAATATPGRQPNANGWYNAALTVSFAATDAMAGVDACDPARTYNGPDAAEATVSGACRDRAGNSDTDSYALKYDATAPGVAASPSRPANASGWYNAPLTVSFSGTDGLSGLASCQAPGTYAGPDSGTAVVSGTCLDKAGNGALASLTLKYDATAPAATATPSRQPNGNGWYNAPLTVSFAGSDALSGLDSCPAPAAYAGPDSGTATVSGTCRDKAGNGALASFPVKYDATAPVTSAAPSRQPNANGWYNGAVTISYAATDAMSGAASCTALQSYSGPDDAAARVRGSCSDRAGNSSSNSSAFKYDATAPDVTNAVPVRLPDRAGWYNRPIVIAAQGTDSTSGLASCPPVTYAGPDGDDAPVAGTCLDLAGNVGSKRFSLDYDATGPQATAAAGRGADANGWYNHALTVSYAGGDAVSGIEACTHAIYAGPDSLGTSINGSCRDRAANGSAAASFALRYDGSPPTITRFAAKAGNRSAELGWSASADTTLVEVRRSDRLVYRGTDTSFTDKGLDNGKRYRYALTAYDEASNSVTARAVAAPTAPLVSPAAGAKVSAPPRLAWIAAPKATYYNVQVWRRGRILSLWPRGTSTRLQRTWTYNGRRYRLTPGRYRWFVWPGYGKQAEKNFGRLLGSSSFVVVRAR